LQLQTANAMKNMISLFFFSHLLAANTLMAQPDSIKKSAKWKIGFLAEGSFIEGDFSSLNNSLISDGLPALQETYGGGTLGISVRPSDKDSYYTLKLFALTTGFSHTDSNANGASVRFLGLQSEWHRDLVKSRKWRIGPDFGFGAGALKLLTYERFNSVDSFSANPLNVVQQEKELYSASFFLNAGMGIDRKFKIENSNFYLGMGFGYRFSAPVKFHEKYQSPYYDTPGVHLSGLQYNIRLRLEL
jgi:hypothetical protein